MRGLPRRYQARRWPIPHRRQRVSSRLLQILAEPAIGRRHEVILRSSTARVCAGRLVPQTKQPDAAKHRIAQPVLHHCIISATEPRQPLAVRPRRDCARLQHRQHPRDVLLVRQQGEPDLSFFPPRPRRRTCSGRRVRLACRESLRSRNAWEAGRGRASRCQAL